MGNNKSAPKGTGTGVAPAQVSNQVTVNSPSNIDAIRRLLSDPTVGIIAFSPGIYELSGSFPSEHIFTVNRPVTLKALHENSKPILNINNTAFDPNADNTQAGAILVDASGSRVEFDNLIINTNRSLDVIASNDLKIHGCEITTTGGPANSAVYLGDYFSRQNDVTGDVIIEHCRLVAEPGGETTRRPDKTLIRENFNAGIFAHFTSANYQVRHNYLSGNAGVECCGTHKTVVEHNTILAQNYINSWVSFGIVVTNNPGTSVDIRHNTINMDLPAPIEDPFNFAASPPNGFGPGNGIGVQHGVGIHVGQLIFDLPAYDVTVEHNEVSGNASFMIWAYRVTGGRIQSNERPNLHLLWFDYNAQRTPPLVPFNTALLNMPAVPPYPANFIGMDFTEYGVMGKILNRDWWRAFILGYVPASEYCLMYSTNVHLLDNEPPVARFFDFNGTFDPETLNVTKIPTTNKILGNLRRVN